MEPTRTNARRQSGNDRVHWDHLPHDALSLEIASRVSRRDASDAEREVRKDFLRGRINSPKLEVHDGYINLISAELKRELRICRDVYAEFFKALNKKSPTAKARVALDYAVVPLAARRLRQEVLTYISCSGMSDFMFAALYYRLFGHLALHPNFNPDWITATKVVEFLIPDICFRGLKDATPRQLSFIAQGPFGDPVEPFQVLYISGREVGHKPNTIWDHRNELVGCELWRLWDSVFREICDQHAAIDCEEKSNVALALIGLSPFERLAGRMFFEASERSNTQVPNEFFLAMGRQLDEQKIGLLENLDPSGREIVRNLARHGKPIGTWERALADTTEYKFLPTIAKTRVEATTLKNFGKLSRSAKRAFYRAKDAYVDALERIYEQRVPASMRGHPFRFKVHAELGAVRKR